MARGPRGCTPGHASVLWGLSNEQPPPKNVQMWRGGGQDCSVRTVRPRRCPRPTTTLHWVQAVAHHEDVSVSLWRGARKFWGGCQGLHQSQLVSVIGGYGALLQDAPAEGFLCCFRGEMTPAKTGREVSTWPFLLNHLQKMFPTHLRRWTPAGPALAALGRSPGPAEVFMGLVTLHASQNISEVFLWGNIGPGLWRRTLKHFSTCSSRTRQVLSSREDLENIFRRCFHDWAS